MPCRRAARHGTFVHRESCRVARGRGSLPSAPTDPYVRAPAHTAPRIVDSLRVVARPMSQKVTQVNVENSSAAIASPTPLSVFVSLIRYPKLDVSDVFLKDGSTIRRLAFPMRSSLAWKQQDLSSRQGTSIVYAHMFLDPGRSRRRLPVTRRSHGPCSQHDGRTHD